MNWDKIQRKEFGLRLKELGIQLRKGFGIRLRKEIAISRRQTRRQHRSCALNFSFCKFACVEQTVRSHPPANWWPLAHQVPVPFKTLVGPNVRILRAICRSKRSASLLGICTPMKRVLSNLLSVFLSVSNATRPHSSRMDLNLI